MRKLGASPLESARLRRKSGLRTPHAADAAAREARRVVREERKAELHAGVEERVGKLKEKLHVS